MIHSAEGAKMYDERMTEGEIRQALVELIAESVGVQATEVLPGTDIEHDLGCVGDDFHELMDAYSTRFKVDMNDYRWYFHTQEEGMNLGSMDFPPPNDRVERIPVTPALLAKFAVQGSWGVAYPAHDLPEHRLDLTLNRVLLLLVVAWVIYWLLR